MLLLKEFLLTKVIQQRNFIQIKTIFPDLLIT